MAELQTSPMEPVMNPVMEPVNVPIVAIGASAGGIIALQKLFQALPANLPFALVVLQHLPPGHPSGLATLIAKWTPVPTRAATNGARPEPNCVYIPSPDDILTLENSVFRTRPAQGGGRRPGIDTIDAFLESLALHEGRRPIAVILSGTGMDGTAGAICIRKAGGIVIVQDPLTCLHDGMPLAVIQRGIHDHVLPVGAIARQLMTCSDPRYTRPARAAGYAGVMSGTLNRIIAMIRQQAGFDLSGYKPSPLFWRIQQRMETRKVWSFDDYACLVEDDPVELEALVRGIPIHVTEFFRDAEAWSALHESVLTPLVGTNAEKRPIRVWTPACSTGEEAYSAAMLLDEIVQEDNAQRDFQIFATDAAPELVATASRGLFREDALAAIPAARRAHYFYKAGGALRVKRFLREKLVFVPHDLISDPPFSALDLVTCRNLLIYLEPETVKDVLSILHGALRMGGFLFLGKSEPYQLDGQGFETVSRQWNIYRKVGPMPGPERKITSQRPGSSRATQARSALRVARERFDIPSVLIDDECSVLRIYGNTENILSPRAGEPTLKLTDLVPQQWAGHLHLSVREALAEREPLTLTNLRDRVTGEDSMSVRLTPLQTSTSNVWDRLLVTFIREPHARERSDADDPHAMRSNPDGAVNVDWKDQACISREELEASREELQALNEELKASNEQLNESNEELNEANIRLQQNIAQLAMQSRVLQSGAVMTLFLDQDLKLRWFTPAMREVFSLKTGDVGRSIADLVPRFEDRAFLKDIDDVLQAAEPREAAVRNNENKHYLRKIYPYVSEAGVIAGVAITFADITARTRAEVALRRNQAWLSAQKDAFQAAMNGASLDRSLGILIRTLVSQADDDRRCAFYIADGNVLHHVVGMTASYARCVDGFRISPESLACGLAVAIGEPVITPDVLNEPRWQSWTWLAQQFGYRGCWSFPVETSEGNLVGSLAMYFEKPRAPSAVDLELAAAFTQTAGIIIWRYLQSV